MAQVEFTFLIRRAEQLYCEGETGGAIRLLEAVDEAQVTRFAAWDAPDRTEHSRAEKIAGTRCR